MSRTQVRARRWWTLGALSLSLFISLDNTILNVGLPTLVRDLGASASQLQWIVDAYILVFAGLLLTAGSLGDRFGRTKALVAGLAIFGVGSALALFVDTADRLIGVRALMGIGGAFIMPATLSILTNVFEADERPKAIAAWASVCRARHRRRPVIGGWLLEHYAGTRCSWSTCPLIAVGLVAAFYIVPESRATRPRAARCDRRRPVDRRSGALLYAIIEAPSSGWDDPVIAGRLRPRRPCCSRRSVVVEARSKHPMLNVAFFKNPRFTAASLSITLVFFGLMGTMFFMTQHLQFVSGFTPSRRASVSPRSPSPSPSLHRIAAKATAASVPRSPSSPVSPPSPPGSASCPPSPSARFRPESAACWSSWRPASAWR